MKRSFVIACALAVAAAGASRSQTVTTGETKTVAKDASGNTTTTVTTTTASGPAATSAIAAAQGAQIANVQAGAAAQTAQIGAVNAAIPGSGFSGAVALSGNNAGTEEATLLTAVAVNGAAGRIAEAIGAIKLADGSLLDSGGMLITASAADVDFSPWITFQQRSALIKKQLSDDSGAVNKILDSIRTQPPPPSPHNMIAMVGAVPIAAIAADVIPRVISYFATDYQVAGITLNPDNYMLEVALVSHNYSWKIATQLLINQAPDDITQTLSRLGDAATAAVALITSASIEQAKAAQSAVPAVKSLADPLKAAIAALTTDVASYNLFMAGLSAAPGGTTPNLSQVLRARALSDAAEKGGILFVNVHSAAGGLITKKNILTAFGAMPFYASSGVVASYVYYRGLDRGNPTIVRSGLLTSFVPYNKIGTIAETTSLDQSGYCDASFIKALDEKTGAAYRKFDEYVRTYCPVLPVRRRAAVH